MEPVIGFPCLAPSSSGPGRNLFRVDIAGSNPAGVTNTAIKPSESCRCLNAIIITMANDSENSSVEGNPCDSKVATPKPAVNLGKEALELQQEKLAQDFQEKARGVHTKIAEEFEIKIDPTTTIITTVSSAVEGHAFKTIQAQSYLNRLASLADNTDGYEDLTKYAAAVMGILGAVAKAFPDKIPRYFSGYHVKTELKIYSSPFRGTGAKSYFPDGSIDAFEEEVESVIVYALEHYTETNPPPDSFEKLKSEYKKSVS